MKFGRNLHRYQIPEWAHSYINYNALKKLFETAARKGALEGEEHINFTELVVALNRDIDHVETFYGDKYAVIQHRATALYDHYGIAPDFYEDVDLCVVDQKELEDLLDSSIELRDGLEKLQWYGKVNRDGFQRILDKLNKSRARSDGQSNEDSRLASSQFASQKECLKDLNHINRALIDLGRALSQKQPGSTYVSLFLENFCVRFYPLASPKATYHVILEDDAVALNRTLQEQEPGDRGPDTGFQTLLLALLECSISHGSRKCIDELLSQVESLQNDKFVDHDNCLHRLIIRIGRAETLKSSKSQLGRHLPESIGPLNRSEESFQLLAYVLDRVRPCQRHALQEKDSSGRLPLHYAAQYGIVDACQAILKRMRDWGQLAVPSESGPALLQDGEGYTPLHLSTIGGHAVVTRMLLDFHKMVYKMVDDQNVTKTLGAVLAIAVMSGISEIVKTLVSIRVGVNYQDKDGKTALYIAARSGYEDNLKIILEVLSDSKADINVSETVYGWTPLTIASIEGHLPVVELLLQAGSDPGSCDSLGWTAEYHAAYRGHMQVVNRLRSSEARELASTTSDGHFQREAADPSSGIIDAMQQGKGNTTAASNRPNTFNRYSPSDESQILVNLGTLDSNRDITAVDLSPYLQRNIHTRQPETGFSVQVGIIGGTGSCSKIPLPVLEDMTNKPLHFSTKDLSQVKLVFNIFRATLDGTELIGGGIAPLETLKQGLGSKRESLIRYYTIPILEIKSLDFLGTVTFNFVVVTSFSHPSTALTPIQELPKHTGCTKRKGLGQNVGAHEHLQIGENTIQSFRTAVDLGASYVEFDVQLTKDYVPVIYHDFLMSETGTDAPLHTLSFEQFMYISEAQSPQSDLSSKAKAKCLEGFERQADRGRRSRSRSLNTYDDYQAKDLLERMKRTFEFKLKGFKGNTRGDYIHEPFVTLQELLRELPEAVGFNIEIKYPMLFETDDWKMDPYAIELNTFVDAILDKIYSFGANRSIIFSSFSPEICILLSIKQRHFPVLFLNDAGNFPTGDVRASSLQEAIHFARSWDLSGIVMASEPFVMCPKLLKYARSLGLFCASYGALNNDPQSAKIQAEAGLDAIIVDDVHLISKTLVGATS
ncbi:MAG: Glycerophosphocholine phosphodiesterase [Peltula sp. TS41687]|nr:MAG: Glycerophosphocholine phosphodiesterase [Peltula sp. TS41687]